jgi:pre-rRNA-processing protein TSR1
MAEQTWPTEEEIASAPAHQQKTTGNKKARRVPVGTSEYQAAWIVDEDGEGFEDEDDEEEEDRDIEGDIELEKSPDQLEEEDDEDEMEDLKVDNQAGSSKDVHFMDLSDEAEQADLARYRADRQRERDRAAKEDEEFPDEIDTPLDIAARERFARYRGMKSLRTSEWDPYENLPIDYSKIFAFQGWKSMGRKLAHKANEQEAGAVSTIRICSQLWHLA